MEISNLNSSKVHDYENGFNWFSPYSKLAKVIAHWEIYKQILDVPGDILELGVLKGSSFIRWLTFREITENSYARKIIGFDAFGEFPIHNNASKEDIDFINYFSEYVGNTIKVEELKMILKGKNFINNELYKGDIFKTIPEYLNQNPQTRISLLHLDMDAYHPTLFALENLWQRISSGGILLIDDYNAIAGATNAVDEFIANNNLNRRLNKNPYYTLPSFIVKE